MCHLITLLNNQELYLEFGGKMCVLCSVTIVRVLRDILARLFKQFEHILGSLLYIKNIDRNTEIKTINVFLHLDFFLKYNITFVYQYYEYYIIIVIFLKFEFLI